MDREVDAEITDGDEEIPYKEIRFSFRDGTPFQVSFRAYPKRVFVAYEDDRENWTSGLGDDVWIAPAVIIEKTARFEFDPKQSFVNAFHYCESEENFILDWFDELKPEIEEFMRYVTDDFGKTWRPR